jgi:Outer membrane protein W
MKATIVTATTTGMFCLSTMFTTTAFAQEQSEVLPKKKEIKAPKLEIGVTMGLMKSMQERQFATPYQENAGNLRGNTSGLFARYYFGKHFAVEAGVNASYSIVKDRYGIVNYDNENYQTWLSTSTYSVPVQLQYHLLDANSRIRPYFGVGGGRTVRHSHYGTEVTDNTGNILRTFGHTQANTSMFLQFTQGLTWQLNNKWQLNQSISLQREFNTDRTNLDFRIGIAYKLW